MSGYAAQFRMLAVMIITGMFAGSNAVDAGDLAAGRRKAQKCKVCHGLDGIARIPDAPNIGGESEFYLKKQLRAFRSGARRHLQMTTIAKALKDDDIEDLAAYYAAIEIVHRVPEIPR